MDVISIFTNRNPFTEALCPEYQLCNVFSAYFNKLTITVISEKKLQANPNPNHVFCTYSHSYLQGYLCLIGNTGKYQLKITTTMKADVWKSFPLVYEVDPDGNEVHVKYFCACARCKKVYQYKDAN